MKYEIFNANWILKNSWYCKTFIVSYPIKIMYYIRSQRGYWRSHGTHGIWVVGRIKETSFSQSITRILSTIVGKSLNVPIPKQMRSKLEEYGWVAEILPCNDSCAVRIVARVCSYTTLDNIIYMFVRISDHLVDSDNIELTVPTQYLSRSQKKVFFKVDINCNFWTCYKVTNQHPFGNITAITRRIKSLNITY